MSLQDQFLSFAGTNLYDTFKVKLKGFRKFLRFMIYFEFIRLGKKICENKLNTI